MDAALLVEVERDRRLITNEPVIGTDYAYFAYTAIFEYSELNSDAYKCKEVHQQPVMNALTSTPSQRDVRVHDLI